MSKEQRENAYAAIHRIRAALAAKQEPATTEQLNAARKTVCEDPEDSPDPWAYRMGWRDAEAHHGIVEKGVEG